LDSRGLFSQKQMNILNKVKDQASEQGAIDDTANETAEKVSKKWRLIWVMILIHKGIRIPLFG
jgi:hypothetical protein